MFLKYVSVCECALKIMSVSDCLSICLSTIKKIRLACLFVYWRSVGLCFILQSNCLCVSKILLSV